MVKDSDSFSSLAILLLPTVLALVPIAVFQDAGVFATVLHTVATDIVSALPIAIKGVELVIYASRRHNAFNANMYGMNSRTGTTAAQVWAAECDMKPFVRQRGIVRVSLAASAMVLGILLEIIAKLFAERRKNRPVLLAAEAVELTAFLHWRSLSSSGKQKC